MYKKSENHVAQLLHHSYSPRVLSRRHFGLIVLGEGLDRSPLVCLDSMHELTSPPTVGRQVGLHVRAV